MNPVSTHGRSRKSAGDSPAVDRPFQRLSRKISRSIGFRLPVGRAPISGVQAESSGGIVQPMSG
jgi:hypothetical protein